MNRTTYFIRANDGWLPRYNIVIRRYYELKIEDYPPLQEYSDYGPCVSGVLLGWNRTGLKRAHRKGKKELAKYLATQARKSAREKKVELSLQQSEVQSQMSTNGNIFLPTTEIKSW